MRAAAALTLGAMVLGGLLATGQPAFAQRSIADCDRLHQQQANREKCYAEVQRGGGGGYRDERRYDDDRRYSRRGAPTSKADCDQLHQQQANREQCYAEVRRYENRGSGSSSEPRRSARERESALDDCAARYERGSRSRERCFADVERRYGR